MMSHLSTWWIAKVLKKKFFLKGKADDCPPWFYTFISIQQLHLSTDDEWLKLINPDRENFKILEIVVVSS